MKMLRDPATECKIENANPHANLPKQRQFFHKQIRAKLLKLSHWWPEGPEKAKKTKSNDLKLEPGSCPAAAVSALPSAILSDLETLKIKQIH